MTATPPSVTIDAQALWVEYEKIAMHFNDLLMRLRSQSLAGIAAVSTLVGLFAKEGAKSVQLGWMEATGIFIAMAAFWIAIFLLDVFYYNRLLSGAVAALVRLESLAKAGAVDEIDMSTVIVGEFDRWPSAKSYMGVLLFYAIVFSVIVLGVIVSARMYVGLSPFWGLQARP